MMFEVPDDMLEMGLKLDDVVENSAFPSKQIAAKRLFDEHGSIYFLKACLQYKAEKEEASNE